MGGGVVSLHERGALLSEEIKLNKKVPNNIVACHSHAGIFIVLYLAGVQRKRYNKEIICRNRSGKDMISFSKYGFVRWEFANSFSAQQFVKGKREKEGKPWENQRKYENLPTLSVHNVL